MTAAIEPTVETFEQLVDEVTRRVLVELRDQRDEGRWLCGARAAAEYLGCSPKRIYARLHHIPHVRDGGRLMFRTSTLDEWLGSL